MNDQLIDNREIEEIMDRLESLEDENLAVLMLKEFNQASSTYGKLLLNLDQSITHEEWKIKCDEAKKMLDMVLKKIRNL